MDLFAWAERPLASVTWVAFDTEATGYSNVSDRVLEVAGVRFAREQGTWATGGEFCELVKPDRAIPTDSIAVHGIDEAMVSRARPEIEVLDRFFEFAGDAVLLAHYAPFDVGVIAFAYHRAGRRQPSNRALDTFPLPRKLFPGVPNFALDTLARELDLPPESAHRALPDARTTRRLFERCVAAIGDPEALRVGDLLAHAGPPLDFESFGTLAGEPSPVLEPLEEAIALQADLTIEYRGGSQRGPRRVTPSHLFAREGHVFLEALCHRDGKKKSFRIDRIERAERIPSAVPASGTSS